MVCRFGGSGCRGVANGRDRLPFEYATRTRRPYFFGM